jgi:hypothetical protein
VNCETILALRSVDVSTKLQKEVDDASVAFLRGMLQRCTLLPRDNRIEVYALLDKVPKHNFLILVANRENPIMALTSDLLLCDGRTYHPPVPTLISAPCSSSISANVKSPLPLLQA